MGPPKEVKIKFESSVENDDSLTLLNNLPFVMNFNIRSLIEPIDKCEDAATQTTSPCLPIITSVKYAPPSLTELITQCLQECHTLQVKDIYEWISNRCPYYERENSSWKNAVRHTLSTKRQFKKIENSRGKGYMWFLDSNALSSDFNTRRRKSRKKYKKIPAGPNVDQNLSSSQPGVNIALINQFNEVATLFYQVFPNNFNDVNSKQSGSLQNQINFKNTLDAAQNPQPPVLNENYSYLTDVSGLQLEYVPRAEMVNMDENFVNLKAENEDIKLLD